MAYVDHVFINCPFDNDYRPTFEALVFAVHDCGYVARCAWELNEGKLRLSEILRIIRECQHGIHDISRTEIDPTSKYPRFNMPLELGLFLGAREFGGKRHADKRCLILERNQYQAQVYCSDLGGQDVRAHEGDWRQAVGHTRDFLANARKVVIPSGERILTRYRKFRRELPAACRPFKLSASKLPFFEFATFASEWQQLHP
jgi:hypothetical protein